MPVRVRIHSSFVSTLFSRAKLVTTRGGTYPATPVIFAAMRLPIRVLHDGINSQRLYAITYARDKVSRAQATMRSRVISKRSVICAVFFNIAATDQYLTWLNSIASRTA